MILTLALDPADAARLPRLPLMKTARSGRARSQTARMVWHDTLGRDLAAMGLSVVEERAVWRLIRHVPLPADLFPPATDHRVIAEAATAHALPLDHAAALTPVAAFVGRRTVTTLSIESETVTMTLLDGALRAVAAERPLARLILDGPDAAVRVLILALNEQVALSVPDHGLAALAIALADGSTTGPRRLGAPELAADLVSPRDAFVHIISHLACVINHWAPIVADAASGPEPVHQIRVAVRRARSAIAVFAASMEPAALVFAAAGLKHLSGGLGPARDWDVFVTETAATVEAALPGRADVGALARAASRKRHAARAALAAWLRAPEFRVLTLELACLAARTDAARDTPDLTAFAAAALGARMKKLRRDGKRLEQLDDPALHVLRLKAKRMRYAAEFFAPLFPRKATDRFIDRLAALQERLGVFNDTAVAEALLGQLAARPSHAAGIVLGFTAARGGRIRPRIQRAWARLADRTAFWE